MCDDCHLTALAAYAVRHDLTDINDVGEVFHTLAFENVRSLDARYPRQNHEHDGKPCPFAMAHTFSAVAIVKAADCYAYQACEHAGWRMSPAYLLVSKIRLDALGPHSDGAAMPGYMRAAWGIDCPHSRALSSLGGIG